MNNETWILDLSQYNNEIWYAEAECNTREEVIREGTKIAKKEGLKFFRIGTQELAKIPSIDVELALERVAEDMYDNYEVAEDYLQYVDKKDMETLEKRLNEIFQEWLKETNNEPSFYKVHNEEIITIGEALRDET